jgi:hypothetical protein
MIQPSACSSRTTSAMSSVLWKISTLVSSELNFSAFSCSAGSLSASTPRLPKRTHSENPLYASTLLVAAVTRRRIAGSVRYFSSCTVRTTRPTSRKAV